MRKERKHTSRKKRYLWVNVAVLMALFLSLAQGLIPGTTVPTVYAHNLQTKMVYMFFDPETQDLLDTRIPTITPPEPLLWVGDELGLIIKVVPRDGTDTGVGGYIDFYVPNGVTVVDAAYLLPDGSGGFDQVPMKGQSLIAVGDGPVGTNCTPALGDPSRLHLGPNINGMEADAVDAAGCHNGTVAGVYGDVGIFYSTDPDTNYNSWTEYGGYDGNPATSDNTITNNSGDVIVPLNKWDAEQLLAYGSKAPASPIVDPNGRGNAPWGNANGVSGPQSGYAWQFDWEVWKATGNMKDASNDIGPWKRTQYPGSMISYDQPGLKSTTLGIASIDASTIGYDLSPSHPLPSTVSQTDTASPKVYAGASARRR